jgi:hypothetical protein
VATLNRVGKGGVLVGTPVWLNTRGDPTRMHSLFSEIMRMVADELTPVKVLGSEVKVMVNRNETGWVVTLMNQRGITIAYPGFRPAVRQYDTAGVVLEPKFEYSYAREWLTEKTLARSGSGPGVSLTIPPGEIRIVEFAVR